MNARSSLTVGFNELAAATDNLSEGRDLAKRFGAQCIETSAKQRVNVDDAFVAVVRAIRRYQRETGPAQAPPAAGSRPGPTGGVGSRPAENRTEDVDKGCCGGCVVL